jgi:hypothetical protein
MSIGGKVSMSEGSERRRVSNDAIYDHRKTRPGVNPDFQGELLAPFRSCSKIPSSFAHIAVIEAASGLESPLGLGGERSTVRLRTRNQERRRRGLACFGLWRPSLEAEPSGIEPAHTALRCKTTGEHQGRG